MKTHLLTYSFIILSIISQRTILSTKILEHNLSPKTLLQKKDETNQTIKWEKIDFRKFSFLEKDQGNLLTLRKCKYSGTIYYAKFIKPEEKPLSKIKKEKKFIIPQAEILSYLDKKQIKNINKARHFIEFPDGTKAILLEELPPGQTLWDLMVKLDGFFPEEKAVKIIINILKIIKDLENISIYHWDIKPQNIWISDTGEITLFDFDLSFRTYEEFISRGLFDMGSNRFKSYNRLDGSTTYSIKDEMYSVALIFKEMMDPKEVSATKTGKVFERIFKQKYEDTNQIIKDLKQLLTETTISRNQESQKSS